MRAGPALSRDIDDDAVRILELAFEVLLLGVIAEIQMRTYYESRGKRAYIVRKTINID